MDNIEIKNFRELPFGENINQPAAIAEIEGGIEYEVLSDNKTLEYIDYLNLSRAVEILSEFFDVPAGTVAKENTLCAAALGSSIENVYEKLIDCDPISITSSTIGFSKTVPVEIAKQLKAMKIKNVVAPKFEKETLEILKSHGEINIIQINSPLQELLGFAAKDIKVTPFGYLVQDQNRSRLTKETFKVSGKIKPTQQQAEDAIFAWKVSKYTKTKSAVIAKDLSTKAIVQGKSNGVISTEIAMDYACESSKDAVLALDGVIENEETINAAIQGRIGLIIEAGNGINSDKIIKLADKYNISIITTGIRNNKY